MSQGTLTANNDITAAFVETHPQTKVRVTPAKAGCRFCGEPLRHSVVDLGMSPLCEKAF